MKKGLITSILSTALFIALSSTVYASGTTSIVGSDYVNTSVKISQKGWTSSDYAVLASVDDFPDALGGTSLAGNLDCPIFFVSKDKISDSVSEELKRLNTKTVYVLGGEGSISSNVENNIQARGYSTKRLAGTNRFETAVAIGEEIVGQGKTDTVFIANGYGFADALSVASFAGKMHAPILLTNSDSLNDVDIQALKKWNIKNCYVLGGKGVIKDNVLNYLKTNGISYSSLAGSNRYETSQAIVKQFDTSLSKIAIATGKDYHDALVAAPYASKLDQSILLIDEDSTAKAARGLINDKDLTIIGRDTLTAEPIYTWDRVKEDLLKSDTKDCLYKTVISLPNTEPQENLSYVTESGIQNVYNIQSIRSKKQPYMDMMIDYKGMTDHVGIYDHSLAKEASKAITDYYNLYNTIFGDGTEIYRLIHNSEARVIRVMSTKNPTLVNNSIPVVLFYDNRRIFVVRYKTAFVNDPSTYRIFISAKGDNSDIWEEVKLIVNGLASGTEKYAAEEIPVDELRKHMPELKDY